jgi:hypothetical protein
MAEGKRQEMIQGQLWDLGVGSEIGVIDHWSFDISQLSFRMEHEK